MIKRLFALSAMALASSACLAQSSVTTYGLLDLGVTHVTGLRGGTDNTLSSGIMEGSRLGFRGNEDLGGGYRAIFTLEMRLEANNGTLGSRPASGNQLPDRVSDATLLGLPAALQPAVSAVADSIGSQVGVNLNDAAFDRQAYVGLVTPVGAVLLGKQYTPAYEISAQFETLGTQSSLSLGQIAAIPASIDIRMTDALSYRIVVGGLTASAMVSAHPTGSGTGRFMGAMAMYKGNGYSAGIGYNQRDNELDESSLKSAIVGATMDLGPGVLNAVYATVKDDNPTGLSGIADAIAPLVGSTNAAFVQSAFIEALKQDGHLYQVGYKFMSGPHTVYVAYNTFNDRRPANADVSSYGAVYSYALSKRTDLNFVATHFDNKNLAQAAPGQAGYLGGVTETAGTDSNAFAVGIRHRF